jgi:hypothetical protein
LISQIAVYALQTLGLVRVVRVMGRLGLAGFLHLPVFLLTGTGPATGSAGSRVDLPGRSEFNNYGFYILKVFLKNFKFYLF